MSHFSLLIIGDNPEAQLEAFWELDLPQDELEQDYRSEFYPEFKTPTKKDYKNGEYVNGGKEFDSYEEYLEYVTEDMAYNKDTDEYGYYRNPNAKYDWYELGGRWAGSLKLKPGESGVRGTPAVGLTVADGTADSCKVSQLSSPPDIPFAVLKDGVWNAKGEMGWFGVVSNAKDEDIWEAEVRSLLADLPGDTMLSLYDCHI